jgi:DNA helicase-4
MDGCICMDDAVQIVAAAGSGKTSTMVARVGYALHEDLVQPEQILVLAFNRAVAEELRPGSRPGWQGSMASML